MSKTNHSSKETLQHFSQQLLAWSHERLAQQPGPFRQAELCRNLVQKQALPAPPLVFWVNRESFLAGGVIVLPNKNDDEIFDAARLTALALGLPYFFTWGRYEIRCWSTLYSPPEVLWEYGLPYGEESSPNAFRKSFNLLIDQIEGRFFEFQSLIPKRSPDYLANLIISTYRDLLPETLQAARLDSADKNDQPDPVVLRNRLLFQLFIPPALALEKRLPSSVVPEQVMEILEAASATLSTPLGKTFCREKEHFEFPAECRRRYTHYVRRIQQMADDLPELLAAAARIVLDVLITELGGDKHSPPESKLNLVSVNTISAGARQPAIEIAPPGITAATALVRHPLDGEAPTPAEICDAPFELKTKLGSHYIYGILTDESHPGSVLQKELNTRLRSSWPNHKISLPGTSPGWVWSFLHLCGLAESDSRLELIIPKNWLWEKFGRKIPEIIKTKLAFSEIAQIGSDNLKCILHITDSPPATTVIREQGALRMIEPLAPDQLRPLVIIALYASDEIFHLLGNRDLQFFAEDHCQSLSSAGLQLYLQSSLGRSFWKILAPGRSVPDPGRLLKAISDHGIPLPNEKVLKALAQLSVRKRDVTKTDIDQELEIWLGATTPIMPEQVKAPKPRPEKDKEDLLQQFSDVCQCEEIPHFPENYIFKIPENQRIEFNFDGKLKVKETFFDEVVMVDRKKNELTVRGIRQAEALEIVSTSRSGPIALPMEEIETEQIMMRYIHDLKALRKSYFRHAATLLQDESVTAAVNTLWKKLKLPDWELIKNKPAKPF